MHSSKKTFECIVACIRHQSLRSLPQSKRNSRRFRMHSLLASTPQICLTSSISCYGCMCSTLTTLYLRKTTFMLAQRSFIKWRWIFQRTFSKVSRNYMKAGNRKIHIAFKARKTMIWGAIHGEMNWIVLKETWCKEERKRLPNDRNGRRENGLESITVFNHLSYCFSEISIKLHLL